MREILFRGKMLIKGMQVTNDDWVYGAFCPKSCYHPFGPMVDMPSIIKLDEPCDGYWFEVDPATVGQYTGLTDKNGKRIFEGDVIECWSEGVRARGTVQQNRGGLWIIYPAWQKLIMWGLCPNEDGSTDVEIIGNIHDNPELLEGGDT